MNRSLLAGILWFTGQSVIRQIISFGLFVILGRILGPADFGTVSISISVILILQAFSAKGVTQAIIQRPNLTDDEASVAYTLTLVISIVIAAAVIIVSVLLGFFYSEHFDVFYVVLGVLALSLPISAMYEIQQARLIRDFEFHIIAKKAVAAQIVGGIVAVGSALLGAGVWSLVSQQFVTLIIELWIVISASRWKPRIHLDRASVSDFSRFGAHLFGANLLNVIDLRGADLIIGLFSGYLSVGYFRIARTIFDVAVSIFALPIHGVSLPLFSSKQGQLSEVRLSFLRMTEALSWLILPPFITLAIWAPEFITAVMGTKWQASGWILQLLSLRVVVYSVFFLDEPLLVGLGYSQQLLKLKSWKTAITVGLTLGAAPFGFQAMVIAQVVCVFVASPISFIYIARAIDLDFQSLFSRLWRPFFVSAAFAATAILLDSQIAVNFGFAGLIFALTISYICYCVLFYLLASSELSARVRVVLQRYLPFI